MRMIDEEIGRLLHDAAERIVVPSELEAVLAEAVVIPVHDDVRRGRRPARRRALVAAGLLVVGALGALVLTRGGDRGALYADAPRAVPVGAPPPGSVAAFIADPPAWAGAPFQGWRAVHDRTGPAVRAAFGIVDGDVIRRPITVTAIDGEYVDGGRPDVDQRIVIDGTSFRSVRYGSWQILATTDQPAIVVTGRVTGDADTHLASVAASAHAAFDGNGNLTLRLDRAPAGYSLVVPPQRLADGALRRPTLAFGPSLGIDEVGSDAVDPLLAASGAGVDLRRVHVGEATGWALRTATKDPLTAVVWSPRPGVVLEVVTTDPDRPVADLVALAAATEVLPIEVWKARVPSSGAGR